MASTSGSTTAVASSESSNSTSARDQAEARAAVLASLQSAGSAYDSKLQSRAADLHDNAAAISKQEQELQRQTVAMAKENDKWQKEATKATRGINEIGDVQNWAEMIERDLLVVEETLRLAEHGPASETTASGGSEWRST